MPKEVYWAAHDAWLKSKGTHYGAIVTAVNAAIAAMPKLLSEDELAEIIERAIKKYSIPWHARGEESCVVHPKNPAIMAAREILAAMEGK